MRSDLTDITVVLDRSGSMERIKSDMEPALNKLVKDQKGGPGEAVFTLYQFDDVIELVHEAVPIAAVGRLVLKPRASTALFDAMGQAITEVGLRLLAMPEAERPEKVVFVIITDGLNNASRRYSRDVVFAMVGDQRQKYNWQFLFLGANQDAIGAAADLNIPMANAMNYGVGGQQVNSAVRTAGAKLYQYRAAAGPQIPSSLTFTEEERKRAAGPTQSTDTTTDKP